MPLIALWTSNPKAIGEMSIEQIVAAAGDGSLKDDSPCSRELREYLSQVPSNKIADYIEHCLASPFNRSGFVLQDLVNELGRRLEYEVSNGRYQGVANAIGYDGIWHSSESYSIIAEVKTTDAYRVPLDTIAGYRSKLIDGGNVSKSNSILIVVGRQDTGELEAQIRGSRHAWDIRLISADALIKLVQLKESSEGSNTGQKIRKLLTPMEYTRLDDMVDVMFTTATDVETAIETTLDENEAAQSSDEEGLTAQQLRAMRQKKRDEIIEAIGRSLGTKFISKSRALYWDSSHQTRIAVATSKRYSSSYAYWFAYHLQWSEFLSEGSSAFFVLGCMDLPFAFSISRQKMESIRPYLSVSETDRETYWHINIIDKGGKFELALPKHDENLPLSEYQVKLCED